MEFRRTFKPRWADLDPNRHIRHTAYNDYATHLRFTFLEEGGWTAAEFMTLQFGPVILREEARFLREIGMGEEFSIDMQVAAESPSFDRFRLYHEVAKTDGELAATLAVEGGWMDLTARKLVIPPAGIVERFAQLPRTADVTELEDRTARRLASDPS